MVAINQKLLLKASFFFVGFLCFHSIAHNDHFRKIYFNKDAHQITAHNTFASENENVSIDVNKLAVLEVMQNNYSYPDILASKNESINLNKTATIPATIQTNYSYTYISESKDTKTSIGVNKTATTAIVPTNYSFPFRKPFPKTRFTSHINHLIELVDFEEQKKCGNAFLSLSVKSPYSIPTISCKGKSQIKNWWCVVLGDIFSNSSRVLPGNATLGISAGDYGDYKKWGRGCFVNSSTGGNFAVTNFQEIKRMVNKLKYPVLPWEERHIIPIWRGKPWMPSIKNKEFNENSTIMQYYISNDKRRRLEAVLLSLKHPEIVNAKFSGGIPKELWDKNATNGLHILLPLNSVPKEKYYTEYRVAVVFGGIGAAFRTSIHLSTGTAVVMSAYQYEEWFLKLMTPYINYIPLDKNMTKTMYWIKNNPKKVYEIGKQGQEFYEKYLSFEQNQEHIYELLYRLALEKEHRTSIALKVRNELLPLMPSGL